MSTSGNNSNNSRHVIHLRLQNSGCPETVPTSIEITCQQEFGVRSGAAWETIRAEKGVLGKVRGAFTQAQGLRKEWSGTKYCTIKFTFRSSSEYSRNYQYIDDSGSGKSESLFQIEADNTSDLIQEIRQSQLLIKFSNCKGGLPN